MFGFLVLLQISFVVATYLHMSQGYLIPSCFDSLCNYKLYAVDAAYSQMSQGFRIPSCLASLCTFKLDDVDSAKSHISQGYRIPSCFDFLCVFKLVFFCCNILTYVTRISNPFHFLVPYVLLKPMM